MTTTVNFIRTSDASKRNNKAVAIAAPELVEAITTEFPEVVYSTVRKEWENNKTRLTGIVAEHCRDAFDKLADEQIEVGEELVISIEDGDYSMEILRKRVNDFTYELSFNRRQPSIV